MHSYGIAGKRQTWTYKCKIKFIFGMPDIIGILRGYAIRSGRRPEGSQRPQGPPRWLASQYHTRPKAKRGIAMLSVDKFPYLRKQTRGNEFIPCSNNICDILKRFRSFKIPAIWPKSPYKHSVTRSYRSGKESGRRSESPLWRHQWRSFVFISHADDVKREIRLHISRLLTNQKRESARSMG